jgi:hypothetical protein
LFNQNNNKRIGVFSCTVVALIAAVLTSVSMAQKTPDDQGVTEKTRPLVGRVLADVSMLTFGAGLGPKYTSFIFGVEEGGGVRVVPVKVSYAFFKSDGLPPDSFFDYSKRYELQAVRESKCDEAVKSLAYVKNVDDSGKPLPPTYALRFLKGAPKIELKPDAVLPCYVLRPGKYKVLTREKEGKADTLKDGTLHGQIPVVASAKPKQ